jgi:hypothetical protein
MTATSRIAAVFTANTSSLLSGTRQASAALDRLAADVRGLRGGLSTLTAISGAQLFGSIAAGVANATQSLVGMTQAAAESVDVMSKLAARTGTTYAEMSGLALAGDLAGVGVDKIAGAMTKADRAFVMAAEGSKTAQAAFARIGLSVDELQGTTGAERFQLIAAAIAELPTEAERAAASIAIFGKAGADLLPLFAGGADGIREAMEMADRLGLALTNVQGQNVEAMNDSFTMVGKAIEGVVTQIVANLAPAVTALNEAFVDFVAGFGGKSIGEAIADALLDGADYLAGVADWFLQNMPEVWKYAENVAAYWSSVVDIFSRAVAAAQGVFTLFEVVGNAFGRVIANVLSGLLDVIANVADYIPGAGDLAEGARAWSDTMDATATAYADAMTANTAEAGRLFADAFGERAEASGDRIAGPVTTAFRGIRESVERARTSADEATKQTVEPKVEAKVAIDEAKLAKGLDIRSSAGVNEMLRLMAPQTRREDAAEEANEHLREIAYNTANIGLDVTEYGW